VVCAHSIHTHRRQSQQQHQHQQQPQWSCRVCLGAWVAVSIRQEDQPRTSTLFQFEMSRMPTGSKLELGKHGHAHCYS